MAQKQRTKNKSKKSRKKTRDQRQHSEDKVLRLAIILVVLLFLAGAAVVGVRYMNPRPDITEGMKKLDEFNRVKASEVEQEVAELEQAEAEELEKRSKRPNSEKFQNTLIIGDFTAQGVYEQEILNPLSLPGNRPVSMTRTVRGLQRSLTRRQKRIPRWYSCFWV